MVTSSRQPPPPPLHLATQIRNFTRSKDNELLGGKLASFEKGLQPPPPLKDLPSLTPN